MSSRSNKGYVNWIEEAISKKHIELYNFGDFKNIESVGTYDNVGTSYRANWKNWKQFFGLKSLIYIEDITVEELVNELKLHRKVDFHDNIVNFYGISEACGSSGVKKYLLVVDFAEFSLQEYLRINFNKLTWKNKFQLAYQLTNVVSYLHCEGIVHRDLHSGNVLIHQGNIKLADFGLSRRIREASFTNEPFKLVPYIEPKRLTDKQYSLDEKSDVYSVGVLLWEISSGKPPLHDSYEQGDKMSSTFLVLKIFQGQREAMVPGTPKSYVNIYQECWDGEPSKRPPMIEASRKLKEIININNLISNNIIEKIYRITNMGKGTYVPDVDGRELFNWLLNNLPDSDSSFLLGYLYYYGIGTELSHEKAFNLFSLEQNHILALYYVGLCYQNGHGTNKNEELALKFYRALAEKKCAMGQTKLGDLFSSLNQHQTAINWYKAAAENGNIIAMYNLAKIFLDRKDYINAIELLEKSANEGYLEAINALGYCHEKGYGTNPNLIRASELYHTAAILGCCKSQLILAKMLLRDSNGNNGNKENLAQAIFWFKKAADQGDEASRDYLRSLSNDPNIRYNIQNLDNFNEQQKNSALMILNSIP